MSTNWSNLRYAMPSMVGTKSVTTCRAEGRVVEARVCRTRNGISANYSGTVHATARSGMHVHRRRVDRPTKCVSAIASVRPFDGIRQETFDWLSQQDLAMFPFVAGVNDEGIDAVVICPANAGFFAMGLALLQGILDYETIRDDFNPQAVIYVAPRSGIRTSMGNRSWCITAPIRCMNCLVTTSIRGRVPRKASTAC